MIFACDDCYNFRSAASTSSAKAVVVGLFVIGLASAALVLIRARKAQRARARGGWAVVAVGLVLLSLATLPLINEVVIEMPVTPTSTRSRVFCDKPITVAANPRFSSPEPTDAATAAALEACRSGFATSNRQAAALVIAALVLMLGGAVLARRPRDPGARDTRPVVAGPLPLDG